MATINYFIQSKNNPAGIYIRLREGRNTDAKTKTKFAINPEDWSAKKGQPKNLKDENLKLLNSQLQQLSADLLNHYNLSSSKTEINSLWLKEFITPTDQKQTLPLKLIDYIDYYALHVKNSIEPSSFKKINVNKHLLERFQQLLKTSFYIKDVNDEFKLKFETYCKQEGYAQNTIARSIKFIKTICYHARNNGLETHYQLNSIKTKTEKIEKVFLTPDELQQIETTKLNLDYLNNARDWLLISCETGQRVSDFMRFSAKQIRFEGEVPLLEFTQEKTNKIMAIPLSKKVREILARRGNNFPRKISDQRYNEFIKEVCKLAGIDKITKGSKFNGETKRKESGMYPKHELVTSHIGRRTFATNNYGRIPTSLLINVTGHSTESMFLEYIGKTVTEKAIQLANYF